MVAKKVNIGGQALIEGVLIRSPNYVSVAVRKKNKKIKTKLTYEPALYVKYKKFIFLRGILALWENLKLGVKETFYSTEESTDEKISNKEYIITFLITIPIALLLFVGVPLILSKLIAKNTGYFDLIDGIFRIAIFLGYIWIISKMKDIQRVFQYHGAEHMTIACYENDKKLTINNIKKFPKEHERCGTAFLFIVLLISILFFSFIKSDILWKKFVLRILLIPAIAGVSYEILKLSSKYKNFFLSRWFIKPGLWLQYITTRKPTEDMIEVAKKAVENAVKKEKAL